MEIKYSLLENNDYVQSIEQIIDEQTNQNYETVRLTWEMIKLQHKRSNQLNFLKLEKQNFNKKDNK